MIYIFDDFEKFQEKARECGITNDLAKLRELDILFYEVYDEYMVISFVAFESKLNKIVVLSKNNSLVFPSAAAELKRVKIGKMKTGSRYLESTMCAYAVLRKAVENYTSHFDWMRKEMNQMETGPLDMDRLDDIERKARRFRDLVEDLHGFLIKIEEKEVPFINVKAFPFEFDILRAEVQHLNDRATNMRREVDIMRTRLEMRQTGELNKRIEKLTDIMKKLTALTVIFMIPNIISSHFGMNFRYMPELYIPEAYPVLLVGTLVLILIAALLFRKLEWL
ncbi:MAG: CorA family divalent cation transporter [Candidatus Micrarchaeota archaeon]